MLKPHRDSSSDLENARRLSHGLARRDGSRESPTPAATSGYVDLRGIATPPAAPATAQRGENVASGFEPDAEAFGSDAPDTAAQMPTSPAPAPAPTAPPEVREPDPAPAPAAPPVAREPAPAPAAPSKAREPATTPSGPAATLELEDEAGVDAAFDALSSPAPAVEPESDGGFEFAVASDDDDPFADLDIFDDPEPPARATDASAADAAPDRDAGQAEITAPGPVSPPHAQASSEAAATSSGFDLTGSDDDDELDELFDGILGGDDES